MADRSIVVRLRAEVDGFKREMAEATKAVDQTAKGTEDAAKQADTAMGRMVQSAQKNRAAWDTAGTTLTGFGAAALGGLALATKAAMDWESAWAGVQKTVDGTAPQMDALQAGLRGMARELPATHTEIAAVAEAAGQLGIAVPNILSFTRTMINMGEATNLTADEAATSLARFVNITGTSQSQIGLLGASIVGLGNSFATTESEILGMSMRLAGAGAQANMSEGDILGIATAMSSVGIEAEAGGSAMSQTMKRIGKAVDEGGSSLELFAQVSGLSAQEFSTAWKNDPTTALDAFITGLSGVESQGMTTNGVLAELGITGIREADSLLRLSAASEQGAGGMSLLADAVATGNAEFDKGTALIEEASKRYETAESRIAMARNALVDSAISIGGTVLPAVAELADGVASLAGGFADLPPAAQGSIAVLGGVAGAASLGVGSFVLLFPRVMETVGAFREMGLLSDSTAGKLGRLTLGVGKAGLAFAALAAVPPILNAVADAIRGAGQADALDLGMNELTAGLLEGEKSGRMFDALLGDLYNSGQLNRSMFSDLGATITKVADRGSFEKFIGPLAATGVNDAAARIEELSDAFVLLSQTDLSKAQQTFSAFMAEAERGGATFEDVMTVMPTFRDELAGIATQMGLDGTDSAVLYRIAMGEIGPVVDETTGAVTGYADAVDEAAESTDSAADALGDLRKEMTALADGFLNARQAARDYDDAMKEANETAEKNGKAWENGTQKARENAEALDEASQAALDNATAMERNGEDVGSYLEQQREILWNLARDFGATEEEATAYVDALGLAPDRIQTLVELETEQAKEQWATLWAELGYSPPEVPVGADTSSAEESTILFKDSIVSDDPSLAPVGADTSGAKQEVDEFGAGVGDTPTTPLDVTSNIQPAMTEVFNLEAAIEASGGTVTINGNATQGDQVLDTLMAIINSSDGTVTINGQKYPADQALAAAITAINNGSGTVEIDGDNSGAVGATNSAVGHANSSSGTIDVDANTSSANSSINNAARNRSSTIFVTWQQTNSRPSTRPGQRVATFATGGPIHGPGTSTSDSIPILASNGEHMLTAAEVALAGGHDSVYRMRAAIRAGALRFADGGGISPDGAVRPAAGASSWAWGSAPVASRPSQLDHGAITSIATTAATAAVRNAKFDVYVGGRSAGQMVKVGTAHNGRMGG